MLKKKNPNHQQGYVLIMVAFCMFMMIAMCAMVIDLGRFFIIVRQLQNAADSASLIGAQALTKLDPMDPTSVPLSNSTTGGWMQVKPRIRFILNQYDINSLENISSGFAFTTGEATPPDVAPFQGTTGITSLNTPGRVGVETLRGIVCYNDGDPTQYFRSLEGTRDMYCIANAVQVTVTTYDIPVYFAQIFGMTSRGELSRVGRSNVRRAAPYSCGDPNCSVYFASGIYDNSEPDGGALNPLLSCPPLP